MDHSTSSIAVEALQPDKPASNADHWDRLLIATIFAGMLGFAYAVFSSSLLQPIIWALQKQHWNALVLRPAVIWVAMGLLLLLLRTVLWLRYRPFHSVIEADAPRLSVIIPAYNEGMMVERSIASVASANYPRDRIEIIAVDDGSKDDTWNYIVRAALRFRTWCFPCAFRRTGASAARSRRGFAGQWGTSS